MQMENILELENISKSFGGVEVLHNVSLSVTKGEIHALIGENGAGKSTLMKIVSGVYQPDSGVIRKDGREIHLHNPLSAFAERIGIVHQELSIAGNLSVAQNMMVGREPVGPLGFVKDKLLVEMARKELQELGIDIDPTLTAGNLSVGMQQVVEIAKVLAKDIDILIMDEPTSSLSEREISHLFELLRSIRKQKNLTVIFISHKLDEVMEICDRATVMRDGSIVGTVNRENTTINQLIGMMIGREMDYNLQMLAKHAPGEAILSAKNLCGGRKFHNISFELRPYEILGVFGLVGAGRTETILSMIGLQPLESGEVFLNGEKVHFRTPRDAVRRGVYYVTEDRKQMGLFLTKSLTDNITSSSISDYEGFLGALRFQEMETNAQSFIEKLDIRPQDLHKNAVNFSGGNQQKILLSKALATKPKVLIVDEPTRGVDVGAKSMIHQILRDLAEEGIAVMMISSELPEILKLSDRILVMHEGNQMGVAKNDHLEEKDIMTIAFEREVTQAQQKESGTPNASQAFSGEEGEING